MNAFGVILKILAAILVIAGIIFVVIAYGDKIMGFFKKLLGRKKNSCTCNDSDFVDDCELADSAIVDGDQF